MTRWLFRIERAFHVLRRAFHNFMKDEVFHLSAGLSFFGLLSLIPLTLIMISVVGHVLGQSNEIFVHISGWIHETIPGVSAQAIEFLESLIDYKVTRGWAGLVVLVVASSFLFTSIERTLDIVLKAKQRRNFFHSYAFSIGLVFVVAMMLLVPVAIAAVAPFADSLGIPMNIKALFHGDSFFFVAHAVAFMALLKIVPRQHIRWRSVARGAVLFSALALLARWVFHTYMGYAFDRYHVIYGSLTALVMLVLWMYYLSAVFLYAAEVVRILDDESKV